MKISAGTRFSLLIAAALLLMALGAGFLVKLSVEGRMLEEARRNCAGSISLAAANALDFFRANFRVKTEQAVQLKRRMQLAGRIIAAITGRHMTPETFLEAFPLPEGDSLLLYKNGAVQAARGDFSGNPYEMRDIKGDIVGPAMDKLARAGRPASCVVRRNDGADGLQHYYGAHFYLPQWDMVLGFWTDIRQFEEKQKEFFVKSFEDLKNRYDKINFAATGFIFVADGRGRPVIAPGVDAYGNSLGHMSSLASASSGEAVNVDILRRAAQNPDVEVIFDPPWDNMERMAWLIVHHVKALDWYVGGVVFMDEIKAPGERLSMTIFLGIAGVGLFIFAATHIFARRLSAPLAALAAYARDVPKEDFLADKPAPELLERLSAAGGGDEVAHLAESFRFMDGALRARVRELMETTAGRERMAGELAAARDIQMDLLPASLPAETARGRFSMWAMLEPAREVGGDLYDYFMIDEDNLCVVIGDVSGKGVPAALFMSVALTLLRSAAGPGVDAATMMGKVNDTLVVNNHKAMFVTLFIGILDLRSGRFSYANGGHCRPLLLAGGKAVRIEGRSGVCPGIKPGIVYTSFSLRLEPGDGLFFYTDGVDEAMNAQDEVLGVERLMAEAGRLAGQDPERVGQGICKLVLEHMGPRLNADDITMLCVRYQGAGAGAV